MVEDDGVAHQDATCEYDNCQKRSELKEMGNKFVVRNLTICNEKSNRDCHDRQLQIQRQGVGNLATWHRSVEKLNCFLSPKNQLSDDGQRFFHRETGTKGVIRMMMMASMMKMMASMMITFDDVGNHCKDE